ncbi:phosphonate ABC transporter, permease protein PhnE [Cupriavidus basilensis]|uniref:Phosphonate ABC transporter, permease protein PhnE n=1 Tax=Cupriavidus basilensis TaxID=68895 RepID=A0ABT6AX85_9BURK|nr:phosphonate ABC transporter, permease protein PhnE [Cupriavidus basilensis]MDF3837198.1 phosphonate ABC transporter, permease protein PhnE [Cupriavidus basilensis]
MTPAIPPRAARPPRASLPVLFVWAVVLALLALSWKGADMRPLALWTDSGNMARFAADFFPPSFRDWRIYVDEMLVTVQIAIWGTFISVVLAVPLGLACSSNMVPGWVYQPMRRVMDACRAINEMVFAMLFIVAVGLGPFAGVLALAVHTTGVLAKLFSEAVEAIDPRPVEGVRATGAGALEEIVYGVIPQVLPLWISYALYRFESNVRSASVLGIVGAGGIGTVLWEIIRSFQYAETCAVMIIVIAFVTLIDLLSSQIRKALI